MMAKSQMPNCSLLSVQGKQTPPEKVPVTSHSYQSQKVCRKSRWL